MDNTKRHLDLFLKGEDLKLRYGVSINNSSLEKEMKDLKTDLEKFVNLYKSIGIDCIVKQDGNEQTIKLTQGDNDKLDGYYYFYTIIIFDRSGKFIKQGFWE